MPPTTSRIERQITNLVRYGLAPNLFASPDALSPADLEASYAKVAVFVDGCRWHGCTEHGPSDDRAAKARSRDAEVTASLESRGWLVLRVWEHEEHLGPFIARAQDAIVQRSAARRAEVLRHLADHTGSEWCLTCEQWPHKPVSAADGYCTRCDISSTDHEYEPRELALYGPDRPPVGPWSTPVTEHAPPAE